MGSIFKSKPSTPPVPPSPPPVTYRDEVGGVEQVPVLNSDGSYTYITRRLPLTPEQEVEEAEYKRIMNEALAEITKLSSSDYTPDEATQNILNAWESERLKINQQVFDERKESEDTLLARRGLTNSSAGEAAKRRFFNDKQDASEQLQREKMAVGTDLKNEQLALQQNLYGLASNRYDLAGTKALSSAASGMNAVSAINSGNRASISDYYSRQMGAYNSRLQNTNTGLFGNVLSSFTGTPFSPVGNVLGAIF